MDHQQWSRLLSSHSCVIVFAYVLAGSGPAVALIEEGEVQEDEADVLVVTETMPAASGLTGQGAEGQGALVRNILEAEKALQACPHCSQPP